jgi:hypothetical protein
MPAIIIVGGGYFYLKSKPADVVNTGGVGTTPTCKLSDWSNWSACDAVTCGTKGTKIRSRTKLVDAPDCPPNSALTETEVCESHACPQTPQDCVVSDWSQLSDCSAKQCGTSGTQTRIRSILQQPTVGGTPCPQLSESVSCDAPACPPERNDCVVSDWTQFSDCSVTACGSTGTQSRTRSILKQPTAGGRSCPIDLSESRTCSTDPCPEDCLVSAWSQMSDCDAPACGTQGNRTQTRTVIRDARFGGNPCPPLTQATPCTAAPCPEDCLVSDWSPLSACDARTCGTQGVRTQTRSVTKYDKNGGRPCPPLTQTTPCSADPCPAPIDCQVSEWYPFSNCSATLCGTQGTQRRTRVILKDATFGGRACPQLSETQQCSAPPCPVPIDCIVSDWTPWTACNATQCEGPGIQTRSRTILRQPANGGAFCPLLSEAITCTGPACPPPVDCQMSQWGPLSTCTPSTCGTTGTQTQTRTVITPAQYGGKACGSIINALPCMNPYCPSPDACVIGTTVLPSQWKKATTTFNGQTYKLSEMYPNTNYCSAPEGSPCASSQTVGSWPLPPTTFYGASFVGYTAGDGNKWIEACYPPPNALLPAPETIIGIWNSLPKSNYQSWYDIKTYDPATGNITGTFYYNAPELNFGGQQQYKAITGPFTGTVGADNKLTFTHPWEYTASITFTAPYTNINAFKSTNGFMYGRAHTW